MGTRLARTSGASTASDWSDVQSIQRSGITSLGPRAKGKSFKRLIHLLWSDHGPNIGVVVVGQSRRHIERSGKELEVESQLCRLIDINDLTIWPRQSRHRTSEQSRGVGKQINDLFFLAKNYYYVICRCIRYYF